MDVGEAPGAGQEFPQNQGCPALGEHFRSQRYGAKLAISFHAVEIDPFPPPNQVQFLNLIVITIIVPSDAKIMCKGLAGHFPAKFRADDG